MLFLRSSQLPYRRRRRKRSDDHVVSCFATEPLEPRLLLSNVTVNTAGVHQTIRALGGDAARVVWANNENATDPVGDWATQQLHPNMLRVGIPWKQWNPDSTSGYQDVDRVHNEFLYMQQLQQQGIQLIATAWEAPAWMEQTVTTPLGGQAGNIPASMYNTAADSLTAYLATAKNTYGVNIPYVTFNEANGGFFIYMSAQQMAQFIEVAGPKFVAAGLSTKFLVGDTYSSDTLVSYATPILQDAAVQPYLGPISFHSWWTETEPDSIFQSIAALGAQYNKEIWSPEVGYNALLGQTPSVFATWDNAIKLAKIYDRVLMNSGATVALYWEFQTVNNGDSADVNDYPLATQSLQPYPAFYVVKQFADNLVPGTQIVDISSDDSNLTTLAARNPTTGNSFVQVINNSTSAITTTIHGLPASIFAVYRSSSTENAVNIGSANGASGDYTISIPAQSIITLSTLGVTQPPPGETPFYGSPFAVSSTGTTMIQAEDYDNGGEGVAYHDQDPGNLGLQYRLSEGVDVEKCLDLGGGYDVGWTHTGEWLRYTINVSSAGLYNLSARVANVGSGGAFHFEIDNQSVGGTLAIPDTRAFQTYQTVTQTGVNLTAGQHVLRVFFDGSSVYGYSGNVNYIQITPTPPSAPTPFTGTPSPIAGQIEIENFDNGGEGVAYHDTTPQNEGGAYRTTGVDIETTGDVGGGYDVGWTHTGEWLGFTTNVTAAGIYSLDMRAANLGAGGAFHLEVDGVNVTGTLAVPDTGAFQTYTDILKTGISLSAGQHFLKLVMEGQSQYGFCGNFNWMKFTATTIFPPAGIPYGGTAWPVGIVQAENYDVGGEGVAYHDTTPQNEGGAYRTGPGEGVDVEPTGDVGGGYDVGWTHAGEWMDYTINVGTAGTYNLDARVAAGAAGGTFHVEFAGVDKTGQLSIPNTGGWQNYTTLTKTGISLAAGTYIMRVVIDSSGPSGFAGNFNWFRLSTPAAAAAAPALAVSA
jgi:O-glycosyl hydrolase